MPSTPKLHHMAILNRLFIGWSTPLRAVAYGETVALPPAPADMEFAAECAVVVALTKSWMTSRDLASFVYSSAIVSVCRVFCCSLFEER